MRENVQQQPAANLRASSSPADLPLRIADHELLRRIGRGSYGEVWLARSALGQYRAVKIVHRAAFGGDARPFEREWEGIRRFEPISRSHESQLPILHVGLDEAAGCFYYVMELADDGAVSAVSGSEFRVPGSTPASPQPETRNSELETRYIPRTLRLELERYGRLPLAQCLDIGLALTTALAHLHKHGLVHRDIKPSNIIFVQGRPKLADIGLVTDAGDARSIVGTEGYLAPEGPGSPSADLYSLGIVLYEISTGRDRRHFPDLPVDFPPPGSLSLENPTLNPNLSRNLAPLRVWARKIKIRIRSKSKTRISAPTPDAIAVGAGGGSLEDSTTLLELNEILLKACARDPRQRYQSAEEMHDDLALLQRGSSVRQKRATQRRLHWAKRFFLATATVALVLAVGWLAVDRFGQHKRPSQQGQLPKSWRPSPAAKKLYHEGWAHLMKQTKDGISQSISCFNRAIELEPNYALAYCGLADAYLSQTEIVVPPIQALPEVRKNARRAVEINDNLPDGHVYLGHALMGAYDFAGAEIEFKRAVALGPSKSGTHTGYATLLRRLGRTEQARELQQKAFELEPSERIKLRDWYYQLWSERKFDEAVRQAEKLNRIAPDWGITAWLIGRAYAACGRLDDAARELGRSRTTDDDPDGAGALGYVYGRMGKTNEARALLSELKRWGRSRYVCPHAEAYVHAGLGETAEAINRLHLAYENQCVMLPRLNMEPFWDDLRSDPRFIALLKKVGLEK